MRAIALIAPIGLGFGGGADGLAADFAREQLQLMEYSCVTGFHGRVEHFNHSHQAVRQLRNLLPRHRGDVGGKFEPPRCPADHHGFARFRILGQERPEMPRVPLGGRILDFFVADRSLIVAPRLGLSAAQADVSEKSAFGNNAFCVQPALSGQVRRKAIYPWPPRAPGSHPDLLPSPPPPPLPREPRTGG